jgi:acyl carrier protein
LFAAFAAPAEPTGEYMSETRTAIETLGQLLREVVPEDPGEIHAGMDLVEEVGLSSVEVMELISLAEDAFDIAFPLNDLASIRTLGELAERIVAIQAQA